MVSATEAVEQNRFAYRAVRVWPAVSADYDDPRPTSSEPGAAYRSILTIRSPNGPPKPANG
jgi:hypothetical protein